MNPARRWSMPDPEPRLTQAQADAEDVMLDMARDRKLWIEDEVAEHAWGLITARWGGYRDVQGRNLPLAELVAAFEQAAEYISFRDARREAIRREHD